MSLLIKGGEVIDGSGKAPIKGDVLVAGGRIAAIGDLASYKADEIINASGCFVAPGFINIASPSDRHLSFFSDRLNGDALIEGITTAVCGTGGVSLAPISGGSPDAASNWSKWESLNVDWKSFSDLFSIMDKIRCGINLSFLAGYDSVKNPLAKKKRGLNRDESSVVAQSLFRSVQDGCLGISLSAETLKGDYLSPDEIKILTSLLRTKSAVFAMDFPFGEEKSSKYVEKAADWASYGSSIIINRFSRVSTPAGLGRGGSVADKETEKSFSILESSSVGGRITASVCPLPFEEISLYEIIPENAIGRAPKDTAANIIKKRSSAALEKKWPIEKLAKLWIADSPKAEFLTGKTVAEFSSNRELGSAECFSKLVELSDGRMSFFLEEDDNEARRRAIRDPRIIIESATYESIGKRSDFHKKISGSFVKFIEASSEAGMPIEKTIAKITSLPAMACNLIKRGFISEGFAGDITIIRDKKPEQVIVNGVVAAQEGLVTGNRGGKVIKRNV
ncbi:MAG: hypothetical protein PHP35_01655 [Candidatus Colwellbacteria bacterium]|nr:hypothetical protein [Candidatus Colwellbacteria bacterium]